MLLSHAYHVPIAEGHFKTAEQILRTEFHLVDGHLDPLRGDYGYLAWEDKDAVGRYRVLFAHNKSFERGGNITLCDLISFSYWLNSERLSRAILEQDPMRSAFERVYQQAKQPLDIPHMHIEGSIDDVLASVGLK